MDDLQKNLIKTALTYAREQRLSGVDIDDCRLRSLFYIMAEGV